MRSVAVLIAPLLSLLLYSGPAQAGQRSSHVVIGAGRPTFVVPPSRPIFVPPSSRVVIVQRPFARPFIVERRFVARPFILERPFFASPFVERRVFVDGQVLIVRRSGFESPFFVQQGFLPRNQVLVFDRFGRRLN